MTSTYVHRVFIKASPQAVWDAITDPKWNYRYGYQCRGEYDLQPGGKYEAFANDDMKAYGSPDVIISGEVLECDPPNKLVQTWQAHFDPTTPEEPTKLTFELEERFELTMLTVTHELESAPNTASMVTGDDPNAGGGWPMMFSDLKTLLETGRSMSGQE